jgi:hypothetical protein
VTGENYLTVFIGLCLGGAAVISVMAGYREIRLMAREWVRREVRAVLSEPQPGAQVEPKNHLAQVIVIRPHDGPWN